MLSPFTGKLNLLRGNWLGQLNFTGSQLNNRFIRDMKDPLLVGQTCEISSKRSTFLVIIILDFSRYNAIRYSSFSVVDYIMKFDDSRLRCGVRESSR